MRKDRRRMRVSGSTNQVCQVCKGRQHLLLPVIEFCSGKLKQSEKTPCKDDLC